MTDLEVWCRYRSEARAFATFDRAGAAPARLSYLANGLVGEAEEALTAAEAGDAAAALEEAADAAFYLAMVEAESGVHAAWPMFGVPGRAPTEAALAMLRSGARAAEELKRPVLGRDLRGHRLAAALDEFAAALASLAAPHGGVGAVVRASLGKLAARFNGGRWTAEAQRARDAGASA